ncbi:MULTISPECIES: hypothetical protein [Listeria]|uniref:hypothetical protein n=1 Tax=Listeria TaxID=1637 RepID=UPI000B58A8EB|nr:MULTISPECIES: hypothetical protein [Listeria]
MLQKKYVKAVCMVCFLVMLSILFQPSAKATAPSTFNKVQEVAIQKKIAAIRAKVKVKVDTTHVKKVEEKKVATEKAAAAKKEQEAREEAAAKQAEQSKQAATSNGQESQSGTEKSAESKSSSSTQSEQPDATTGASQSGREIGEKNREYGNQLSDPNLSDAERQRIIEEKKKYNQSHR